MANLLLYPKYHSCEISYKRYVSETNIYLLERSRFRQHLTAVLCSFLIFPAFAAAVVPICYVSEKSVESPVVVWARAHTHMGCLRYLYTYLLYRSSQKRGLLYSVL